MSKNTSATLMKSAHTSATLMKSARIDDSKNAAIAFLVALVGRVCRKSVKPRSTRRLRSFSAV